jgi:hypothetical protein
MQKWGYLRVKVYGDTVTHVNGQQVAREKKRYPFWEGETIESYLLRAGEDGWELVTDGREGGWHTLIFKRPKP